MSIGVNAGLGKGVDSANAVIAQLKSPSVTMEQLIKYSQGSNPLVPSYLALAEINNRENAVALQPGQSSPTTVAQDLVSKALAPQMPAGMPQQGGLQMLAANQQPQQGIPALPSGMGEQSFAGGGIIAFSGAEQSDVEDPDAGLGYFERFKRYVNNLGGTPLDRYGNPISANGTPIKSNQLAVNASPAEVQGARTGKNLTRNDVIANAQSQEDMESPAAVPRGMDPTKQIAEPGSVPGSTSTQSTRRKASDAAKELGITQTTPKEDMFGKYEKMFNEQAAQAKADREKDKWMRMLEAGLGIMGGTSPYALANIGQGAMGAAKDYAQDRAAAQKEDRQNVMDLMNLGMKKEEAQREAEKLAMTKDLYAAHGKYYNAMAATAGQRATGATSMNKAQLSAATSMYNKWLAANPMSSQEEQDAAWTQAQQRAGMAGGGGGSPTASYSWSPTGGLTTIGS